MESANRRPWAWNCLRRRFGRTVPLKGPTGEEDSTTCVPAPLRADLDKGSKGRYVRVVASTSVEWAMLSEIAVAAGTP